MNAAGVCICGRVGVDQFHKMLPEKQQVVDYVLVSRPIWGSRPDIYYCLTVMVLFLLWGTLSDKRMGLSFVHAADPCQCSLSRVRVPWNSWPYFTVSDLRFTFLSTPTTRGVTVKVFDPASTQVWLGQVKVKVTLRLMISQSVSLGVEPHLGLMTRYLLLFHSYGLVSVGHPLCQEDGSVFYTCYWLLIAQSFLGPSPLGLATIFHCLRF
jgi:hypothetical protein